MTVETLPLLSLLLLGHAASTFCMVGLVWFVQHVHYPLFAGVGAHQFAAYAHAHVSRTNPIVGPPMLVEAATALALVALPPPNVPRLLPLLGVALLVVIWLSTSLLQVPRHRELVSGFDASAHRRLVASNWIRTTAWSLRGALVLWMLFRVGAGIST
jgi:hypothetical protein